MGIIIDFATRKTIDAVSVNVGIDESDTEDLIEEGCLSACIALAAAKEWMSKLPKSRRAKIREQALRLYADRRDFDHTEFNSMVGRLWEIMENE